MADMLIRGMDGRTLKRLKERAKRGGRSLQSEAKSILEQAAGTNSADLAGLFARWDKRFAGRKFSPSAELIREDRAR